MIRRELLAATGAAFATQLRARGHWDKSRISAIADGYNLLPRERMLNIQVKGKGVMPASPENEDGKGIMTSLAAAHASMEDSADRQRGVGCRKTS
jgi:hypothetical protein